MSIRCYVSSLLPVAARRAPIIKYGATRIYIYIYIYMYICMYMYICTYIGQENISLDIGGKY